VAVYLSGILKYGAPLYQYHAMGTSPSAMGTETDEQFDAVQSGDRLDKEDRHEYCSGSGHSPMKMKLFTELNSWRR